MSEHYDFHYQPTGSGAISGQQVLQQTEDAINELGDYVNDNVGGAMDVAQQALETAQTAETNAQTALDTANSFSGAIQSAQQDASTALSTAQTAQTTASNANNTAIQAQQDASSAVTTANNASGQVNTLSGTVTALGQRVTTAEGNIGQNTSDITALTTRVGTAEGNITTLQNDVSIAQGNASSAMATAGTVKQQAYVLRYSSSSVTDNSTIAYSTLDNTDNIKTGDKVIDVDGKIFTVVSVDTANQTVTVGSALIDLALDSNVVHTSGNETVSGDKVFTTRLIKNIDVVLGTAPSTGKFSNIEIADNNKASLLQILGGVYDTGSSYARFFVQNKTADDGSGLSPTGTLRACGFNISLPANTTSDGQGSITPRANKTTDFGLSAYQWRNVWCEKLFLNGTQLDPSAFALDNAVVHTSGNETISGAKTFSNTLTIYNNDSSQATKNLTISSSKIQVGDTSNSDSFGIIFNAGLSYVSRIIAFKDTSGTQNLQFGVRTKDSSNNFIGAMIRLRSYANGFNSFESDGDNLVSLGSSSNKWKNVQTYLVNGVEPSSLSLPNIDNRIDISSYITNLSNVNNEYTPSVNGWICIRSGNATKLGILDSATSIGNTSISNTATYLTVMTPVIANRKVYINVICTSLEFAYFIPCQGNV